MSARFTVIKIGGSLLETGQLHQILCRIAECRVERPVVVPGGSVFADAVRAAQTLSGFEDRLAHRLALEAMGHMADVIEALHPDFRGTTTITDFDRMIAARLIPVWKPIEFAASTEVPQSWAVTSDSLALWLATMLDAAHVVLLKSIDPAPEMSVVDLSRSGMVDQAFPSFAARFSGTVEVLGPARWHHIAATEGIER
jgi:aspartokinase-like uncharacterized kinase